MRIVRSETQSKFSIKAESSGKGLTTVPTLGGMETATAQQAFQWSDLARRSSDVGHALDEYGEVTVTRGAQTLRIAPQLSHPIVDTMRDLCRILTAVVAVDSDNVSQILNTAWPWTRVLPHSDQLELATEAGAVAETCESLGTWEPLLIVLADWRRTARAYAQGHGPVDVVDVDGRLARRPT